MARDSLILRWRPTVRFYFAFDGLVDVSLQKPIGKLKVPGLEDVQHPVTLPNDTLSSSLHGVPSKARASSDLGHLQLRSYPGPVVSLHTGGRG